MARSPGAPGRRVPLYDDKAPNGQQGLWRVNEKLARNIRERLWHPSQKFRDLTEGRLELTLHVADTLEVRRWILGYGVQAEVIEPAGMREALRQEATALADRLAPQRKPLAAAGAASAPRRSVRRSPYRK